MQNHSEAIDPGLTNVNLPPSPAAHLAYALNVIGGEIPASGPVRAACELAIDDHQRGHAVDRIGGIELRWIFDQAKAVAACRFVEVCPHTKGRWAREGKTITLEPWQRFFVSELFGWVDAANPTIRRYTTGILFVARKNGKTELGGALGLRETLAGDAGAEVYALATTTAQASIVWNAAAKMAKGLPIRVRGAFRASTSKAIKTADGIFAPLSKNASAQDGLNPSLAIFDESAAITDINQFSVIETAMGARESPLTLHLTTAQPIRTTEFRRLYDTCKRGLANGTPVPGVFAMLYELDDADEVADPDAWVKANPNIDVSASRRQIAEALARSEGSPAARGLVLCKHFNVWAQGDRAWIDLDVWAECERDVLQDGKCYLGLDLARTRDLCAACALWDHGAGRYAAEWKFWAPRESLGQYPDDTRAMLEDEAKAGRLELGGWPAVPLDAVRQWIKETHAKRRYLRIGCDPWHAKELTHWLERDGLPVLLVKQTAAQLGDAVQAVENAIIGRAIAHEGGRMMQWQMENVIATPTGRETIMLMKSRNEPHRKIDGVAALVTAMATRDFGEGAFAISDFDLEGVWGDAENADALAMLGDVFDACERDHRCRQAFDPRVLDEARQCVGRGGGGEDAIRLLAVIHGEWETDASAAGHFDGGLIQSVRQLVAQHRARDIGGDDLPMAFAGDDEGDDDLLYV